MTRLIDADNLKKKLDFVYDCAYIASVSKEGVASDIIDEIDNAPTVKFSLMPADETKEDAYKRGYKKGKIKGILMVNARPQGEWNFIQAGMCVCPFCGAMPHKEYKNFCAKCGAKMKGGAV